MTTVKWLGTTAIALALGTSAVIAQTQGPAQGPAQRDESPRMQSPASKGAERPAASERGAAERSQDRAQQPAPKSGAMDERKQAEEPRARDSKQPTQQSQDQKSGEGRQPAEQRKQSQDQRDRPAPGTTGSSQQTQDQPARDGKQPADQKQQQTRDQQRKEDNRAGQTGQSDQRGQTGQPGDSRQQQGVRQQPAQPQQSQQQPGTAPSTDQAQRRDSTSVSTNINDEQRTRVIDRLQRERSEARTNVNIDVNIGARVPSDVRGRPLPADIVEIVPQYRGYEYTVVEDEIVIIEPSRREVVDVIRRSGPSGTAAARVGGDRVVISHEQREMLRRSAVRTTGSTQPGAALDANCLQLQAVPEELTRDNPQLSSYRMLTVGDQIVLIDPQQHKVVEVVD